MNELSLIVIGNGHEPYALRAICEQSNIGVQTHWIGAPDQLLDLLDHGPLCRNVILSAHGDENGLAFGEFGQSVDVSELKEGSLPYSRLAQCALVKERAFVSTACQGSAEQLGKVLIGSGASLYIGPREYIDANQALLFTHLLIYRVIATLCDLNSAYNFLANSEDGWIKELSNQFCLIVR